MFFCFNLEFNQFPKMAFDFLKSSESESDILSGTRRLQSEVCSSHETTFDASSDQIKLVPGNL